MTQTPVRAVPVRNTRQKRAILDCLAAAGGKHLTAETLGIRLREAGAPVGQATIYRVLKALELEGLVQRHFVADHAGACFRYVGDKPDCAIHFHLVCENCGGVAHIESEILERFLVDIHKKRSFSVDRQRVSFSGKCASCRKEKKQ